jgi:hypothetical protein
MKSALILFLSLLLSLPGTAISGRELSGDRYERDIYFSGYEWLVKSSLSRTGPGYNFFSHSDKNVYTDRRGRLHMSVTPKNGRWRSAEVVSKQSFGYGRYEFLLGTNPSILDKNIVFALFTWDNNLEPHYNEMDIEFSRWGGNSAGNAQYVIHTGHNELKKRIFNMPAGPDKTLHIIEWTPGKLVFESYRRQWLWRWKKIASWTLSGKQVPEPANNKVRINLWLMRGMSPAGGENAVKQIMINSFSFKAL